MAGKVLIHVDQRMRDAVPMLWLKRTLELRGVSVGLCNRANRNEMFYALAPDVFVQSHVFFDSLEELERKSQIARQVVLPTEGALFHPPGVESHYKDYPKHNELFSKAFVWGEGYKRLLVKKGYFDESRVSVVGCPRYDVYRNCLCESRSGKMAGFIGGLAALNAFDGRPMFQLIDGARNQGGVCYDAGKNVEDYYWAYVAQCRVFFEIFDKWILKMKNKCVFRPHPNENRAPYSYMVKKYGDGLNLDEGEYFYLWTKKISGLVMFGSTTIVEAIFSRTPVITLEKIIGERLDDHQNSPDVRLPGIRCSWEPRTVEEAVDMMREMSEGKLVAKEPSEKIRHVLAEMYDWPRGRSSIEHIADEIMELMAGRRNMADGGRPRGSLFHKIISRLHLMRTYLWRWVSYVINRQNYHYDQNYHYFPWNMRDRRDARRIYDLELKRFEPVADAGGR